MACHELDAKGLLQDIDGGSTYNKYMKSLQRSTKLEELINKVKAEIGVFEQLVTILTIASSVSSTTSIITRLGHLHGVINEKRKTLQDMVLKRIKVVLL